MLVSVIQLHQKYVMKFHLVSCACMICITLIIYYTFAEQLMNQETGWCQEISLETVINILFQNHYPLRAVKNGPDHRNNVAFV